MMTLLKKIGRGIVNTLLSTGAAMAAQSVIEKGIDYVKERSEAIRVRRFKEVILAREAQTSPTETAESVNTRTP